MWGRVLCFLIIRCCLWCGYYIEESSGWRWITSLTSKPLSWRRRSHSTTGEYILASLSEDKYFGLFLFVIAVRNTHETFFFYSNLVTFSMYHRNKWCWRVHPVRCSEYISGQRGEYLLIPSIIPGVHVYWAIISTMLLTKFERLTIVFLVFL